MHGGLFTMFLPCFSGMHVSYIRTSLDTVLYRFCYAYAYIKSSGLFTVFSPYVRWEIRCFFAYYLTP